jgi:hypothetical protein
MLTALDHCDYDELRPGTSRQKKEQQCFRTLLCLLHVSLRTALEHDRKATVDINLAARGGFPEFSQHPEDLTKCLDAAGKWDTEDALRALRASQKVLASRRENQRRCQRR